MYFAVYIAWWLHFFIPTNDNFLYHHAVQAQAGDGPIALLDRYGLSDYNCNLEAFYQLNQLNSEAGLIEGRKYTLPVLIYRYNGVSIRSTIGDNDYDKALRIQHYNEHILAQKLRRTHYRDSKILWVPYHELYCSSASPVAVSTSNKTAKKMLHIPVLGKSHADVPVESQTLRGHVYYLIAGHGGPDPGAIGKRGKNSLCEDEYAYDVTLRLYRLLLQHGADAHLIIEDNNDGIRDEAILPCDKDETCSGQSIPLNQAKRLKQRVERVNQLYYQKKKEGAKSQICLSIHVDSRSVNHRQDVFFCHYPSSQSSQRLAASLQGTFAEKYREHRSNGQYGGNVAPRDNLYVLKNTMPPAVLVELANIQNKADHRRIVQASNRQALANWMLEGLLSHQQTVIAQN